VEHVLIVPGERDTEVRAGRTAVHTVAAPLVPGSAPYRFTLRLDKVARILEREKPDVLEFGCAYAMPYAGFRHRRRHPCALVGFYHTDYPAAYVRNRLARRLGPKAGKGAERLAERHVRTVYNRFDLTLAPSISLVGKLRGLEIRNVEHLPLGVDLGLFHPKRRDPQLREFLGAEASDTVFVYAGRLDSEKRVNVIADAARIGAERTGWRFVFVGEGPLRPRIEAMASADPRIRLRPFEPNRLRLARLLASCDAYVAAHPFETFGLSVAEAQACGLAVVGVDSGALRDRVPPDTGILVPPDSAQGLYEGMAALSADGLRAKGRRARAWAESQCSWSASFERLFGLYDGLASEHA
jgi:alpha-1,6-mannosyltransferase